MATKKTKSSKGAAKSKTSKPVKSNTAKSGGSGKAASKKKGAAGSTSSRKKTAPKKTAASKSSSSKRKPRTRRTSSSKKKTAKKLTKRELKQYEKLLWELRDRITEEMNFLSGDNVSGSSKNGNGGDINRNGGDAGDQGSANFDREFALTLLSSESDVIYEIDQALQRIKDGTYGVCEMSGQPIERERLKAIPYARFSVAAKTELENQQSGRRMRSR